MAYHQEYRSSYQGSNQGSNRGSYPGSYQGSYLSGQGSNRTSLSGLSSPGRSSIASNSDYSARSSSHARASASGSSFTPSNSYHSSNQSGGGGAQSVSRHTYPPPMAPTQGGADDGQSFTQVAWRWLLLLYRDVRIIVERELVASVLDSF
ncbi:hypothetical protein BT69DRAFT_1330804 [Atractiella rhizophila]|nr:hypothetical protein BT69DRAFT_1330804 [Atractiella rhizophila]